MSKVTIRPPINYTLAQFSEQIIGPEIESTTAAFLERYVADFKAEQDARSWHRKMWTLVTRPIAWRADRVRDAWAVLTGRKDVE